METGMQVVGNPHGAEILYMEDYVYSFINAVLSEKQYISMEVILFGKEDTENQRHYYYVSGIIFKEEERCFFQGEAELGRAVVAFAQDNYPEIQLRVKGNKEVSFRDYYIYYADNEKMKNYMLSYAGVMLKDENKEGTYQRGVNIPVQTDSGGVGEVVKYMMMVLVMAYIIISMNHYRKLELVGEQAIYVMKTISQQTTLQQTILQEDTFYTP
ncbi:MAG: hypothetical protein E7290_09185 [Lachnospiraceae bacterium]|nr:hypothetical protein [Lachnospiraceae bacterium]